MINLLMYLLSIIFLVGIILFGIIWLIGWSCEDSDY